MTAVPRIEPATSDTLSVNGVGYMEGRRIVFWDAPSRERIATARMVLASHLKPVLSKHCTHTKSHGGVKGTIRVLMSVIGNFRFVGRFDVASYYDSIRHANMLAQLQQADVPTDLMAQKWWRWLLGGLDGLVCRKGGVKRYWVRVFTHLDICDPGVRPQFCNDR